MDFAALESLIHPALLYGACALGAVGMCMALPRGGRTPQIIGAVLSALAGGLVLIGLGSKADSLPNIYFYVFSLIALGAAVRVITHPRPVYAALYFILTVLSSAGLFLILSAEFMAFALIIVYAGAILITYLFVIMLATQAPTEAQVEVLSEYDTFSREPVAATTVGFVLLAALTTMLFAGTPGLKAPAPTVPDALLAEMPRKVELSLQERGLLKDGERVVSVDVAARTASVGAPGATRTVTLPDDLKSKNVEGVGFTLLREHPGSIEIAGVILLMAMLGAVVLSRRQVQIDEDAKMRHAAHLSGRGASAGEGAL